MKKLKSPSVHLDVVRVEVLLGALKAASSEGHKPQPQGVEVARASRTRHEVLA